MVIHHLCKQLIVKSLKAQFWDDLANSSKLVLFLLFADDTTLQISSSNIKELYLTANRELELIYQWFKANKLALNTSKTKYILFRKPDMNVDFSHLDLLIENVPIERIGNNCAESSFKFVGVKIDEFLNWKHPLTSLRSKLTSANFVLSKVRNILPENTKLTIHNSLFKSHLDYCNIAWGKSNSNLLSKLIQKKAVRNVPIAKLMHM